METKKEVNPARAGFRDGRDCFLLDRPMKNPYRYGSTAYYEYAYHWELGYEKEILDSEHFE